MGNFTMLNITGQGTSAENVTFGNYCNIDLEYPLKPALNREKRGSAFVQAQLVFCNGDKLVARNTRFVSRLNLCPFLGGRRVLFDRCHFESTDDSLNGTAVYLNCTLEFYSGKPFGGTRGTGAVFLNCDITSFTRGEQYFTKGGGQVAALDTRLQTDTATYLGWRDEPAVESRNYQYHIQWNGRPIDIGTHHPYATVDLAGKPLLDAYRLADNGSVIYNTYNLLRGDDDWDPMGVKARVRAAEKRDGKSYTDLPTQLAVFPTRKTLETGKDGVVLHARVSRFGNYPVPAEGVLWTLAPQYKGFVDLKVNPDGTCEVTPTNETDDVQEVIVTAATPAGLEAAGVVYVSPALLEPPRFSSPPSLTLTDGRLSVAYALDMRFPDQSLVTWYRCRDAQGRDPIEVAVSRLNVPKRDYVLSGGDVGYYIMAAVAPKHQRCHPGEAVAAIMQQPVVAYDVHTNDRILRVDLKSLSTKYQPKIKPGFWTLDCYAPADTHAYNWTADNSGDPWYYGAGVNGAANALGLVQARKGARLRYTPVGDRFGDMKLTFTAVPAKTAGQGFSSARAQYMDICIKFDTQTLTGYALRLIRTTKYHDAIDCLLMKYQDGNAVPISQPVSTSCYRADCTIILEARGNRLIAHAGTPADYYVVPNRPEVVRVVDMEAEITPNPYGGIAFQHTGSVGSGATLIKDLTIEWQKEPSTSASASQPPDGLPFTQHPALFLVGDSLMKTGSGSGETGPWGYGDELTHLPDITVGHLNLSARLWDVTLNSRRVECHG